MTKEELILGEMTITLTREEAQQVIKGLMSGGPGANRKPIVDMLRARLSAPEPNIVQDAIVYGTGITMGGERVDPASIYKEPEPPCKTGSQCIGGKCPQCVVSEPEPVAWMQNDMEHFSLWPDEWHVVPLYPAPPQREWQGLTDEEIGMLTVFDGLHHVEVPLLAVFARAIEAKLKEKNT